MYERYIEGAMRLFTDEQLNRIHIDSLYMACTEHCVLGQVFGDYYRGLIELDLSDTDAVLYGLTTSPRMAARTDNFATLTREWRQALLKGRMEHGGQTDARTTPTHS